MSRAGAAHGGADPRDTSAIRRTLRQLQKGVEDNLFSSAGGTVSLTFADSPHDLKRRTLMAFADTTGGQVVVNLPTSDRSMKVLVVQTDGANGIVLAAQSGQTIDGVASASGDSRWVATPGNGAWHTI
ncbi:MAG: hypothetical protein ACIAQU_04395 [Phycisphaerales bacterium JB064]